MRSGAPSHPLTCLWGCIADRSFTAQGEPCRISRKRPDQGARPATGRALARACKIHRNGNGGRDECRCPPSLYRVSDSHLGVLQNTNMRYQRARGPTAASPRRLGEWTSRRLQSWGHADPRVDADGGAEGNHFLRHVREHPLPRILPSSWLPAVRISGFVAHSRILWAHSGAVPPCAWNASEATILGGSAGRTLANRLAAHESGCLTLQVSSE